MFKREKYFSHFENDFFVSKELFLELSLLNYVVSFKPKIESIFHFEQIMMVRFLIHCTVC